MAHRERHEQIDQLLDSVLSQYSAVEPRPGLQTRILARIADARSAISARRSILRWAWAAGAAAALTSIIVFSFSSRPATRTPQLIKTAETQPRRAPAASLAQVSHGQDDVRQVRAVHRSGARIRRVRTVDVRQEIFPTPVPLSKQEALLLRYLSQTPRQEQLAQSHPDPPPDEAIPEDGGALFSGPNPRFSNQ